MNEVDTCRTYAVPKVQAAGWEGETGAEFVANLRAHHGKPSEITSVSIDTAPLIKGVQEHFPHAQITLDKFHMIAYVCGHRSSRASSTTREHLEPLLS